jgi:nucleoside diphosphate kinase
MGTHSEVELPWERLTQSVVKCEVLAVDLYLREAWQQAALVLDDVVDVLAPLALLMFKPDAVAGRRVRATIEFCERNGFEPIAFADAELTRHSIRELWRYNWDVYTTDRLAMCDHLYTANASALMLLRDERFDGVVPGSVRLAALKGSSDPNARDGTDLRSNLGVTNRVMNFVHVADEPVDIVRELGILVPRLQRGAILTALAQPGASRPDLERAIGRIEAVVPRHDLSLDASLDRLAVRHPASIATVRQVLSLGRTLHWDEFCILVPPNADDVSVWDFLCVAVAVLPETRPGSIDLLPAGTVADWSAVRNRTSER